MPGVDSLSVRVFWPSTHASVPSGWTRDTNFDEKFLQGDDSGFAGAANGGGSHDHTADNHTHIGNQHRHTFGSAGSSPSTTPVKEGSAFPFMATVDLGLSHLHIITNGAYATIAYQNEVITIDAEDAMPPYQKLIVIKPDSVTEDIPDDAVCYTDEESGSLPTGFALYAAIDDDYVRGPADGDDAAVTGFGAADHDHDSPADVHDHTIDAHVHVAANSGASSPHIRRASGSPNVVILTSAHHTVGMATEALADLTNTAVVIAATTNDPAYTKLHGIQNTLGDATTPVGVVVAFVGAYADVPSNWRLCDGTGETVDCTNTQIKSTAADGEIGDQDGSTNTHTHTTTAHGHTHGAHNHTVGAVSMTGNLLRQTGSPSGPGIVPGTHTHIWTTNNATPTLQNATVTLDGTEDKRSAYRTVIWVKKTIERPGPKELLMTTF